jgi:hypothetical protein
LLSNNAITGSLVIGNVGRSGDTTTYIDAAISNNTIEGSATIRGTLLDSDILGNSLTGALTVGGLSRSRIDGNTVNGTTTLSNNASGTTPVDNSVISDNEFAAFTVPNGNWANCRITGNRFSGAFSSDAAKVFGNFVSANYFIGTVTTGVWQDNTFTGNYLSNVLTTERWQTSTCYGNIFAAGVSVSESGTNTSCIDRITFANNVCKSTVTFAKSGAGTSNNFYHSSFTGNVFENTFTFGTNDVVNEYTRVVFNSNSGDGGLTINTGASSEMDSCMIVGNSMSGAFLLRVSGGGATGYTSPPTAGGTATFMMALNWFASYTGITLTALAAVGWGGDSGAAAPTSTTGGNLTSSAA